MSMKVRVGVTKIKDNTLRSLSFLRKNAVYVGIPEEAPRDPNTSDITNADLLFIHTNGSPINNIPARPVIEPAIAKDKERLSKMLAKAAKLAMDYKTTEAIDQLRKVGIRGQNVSRAWFVDPDNGWPPNSLRVQAAKRAKGSTDPKPLIDTGELRKSITYFVKIKGRRIK